MHYGLARLFNNVVCVNIILLLIISCHVLDINLPHISDSFCSSLSTTDNGTDRLAIEATRQTQQVIDLLRASDKYDCSVSISESFKNSHDCVAHD